MIIFYCNVYVFGRFILNTNRHRRHRHHCRSHPKEIRRLKRNFISIVICIILFCCYSTAIKCIASHFCLPKPWRARATRRAKEKQSHFTCEMCRSVAFSFECEIFDCKTMQIKISQHVLVLRGSGRKKKSEREKINCL